MLKMLHIENAAVVYRADVEYSQGLNVLTGETGAGKSIVIDALGAVLGGRTSKELVRTGEKSALITAEFSSPAAESWCRENDIDTEDGQIFLMRRIGADGKNSCRINGVPVPVSQLRAIGERLLDIHGQNDGQKLLDERYHRRYLDTFGRLEKSIEAYENEYEKYRKIKRNIDSLYMDEREKQLRLDTLEYQIKELKDADIRPGERDEKEDRRKLLQNAEKISGSIEGAFQAMYGSGRESGVTSLIEEALDQVSSAARYSDSFLPIEKQLTDLKYNAQDIAEQLMDLKSDMDFSPQELDDIESRLSLLRRRALKYGPTEEEMLEYLDKAEAELDDIMFSSEKIEKLKAELKKQREVTASAAEKLHEEREKACEKLEKRIGEELRDLSMPNVRFKAVCEKLDEFTPSGMDDVRFEMSANAGERMGRINRIASGGELSRIMLAMKNVLAENDDIETMVFDEIDTGVSGIAAQRVGEKLASLASDRQVICVTHLAQIAVFADEHFEIKKDEKDGRTYTSVRKLDMKHRIREIARMTGGENVTPASLQAAKEQIAAAKEYKKDCKKL